MIYRITGRLTLGSEMPLVSSFNEQVSALDEHDARRVAVERIKYTYGDVVISDVVVVPVNREMQLAGATRLL